MAKKSGKLSSNPYNEGGALGSEMPDSPDSEIYVDYSQVMAGHLSQDGASLVSTPNSESGEGIAGGPAPGEPNPFGMSTTNQSKRGK